MQITLVDYRVNHNFECRFSPNTRTYITANLKTQRVFVDYIIGTLFHGSLILCFSQLWKNRDGPQIKISAKFKHAKFNTHIENSNYRKKWITFKNYNWLYMIRVDKFDMLLAGFTGTFHSMTVSSVVKKHYNMRFACFILSRYFKKFRRLKTKIKLRTLELRNLMSFFILAYWSRKNKHPRNTLLPKSWN